MLSRFSTGLACLLILCSSPAVLAKGVASQKTLEAQAEPSLKVGDPAPALTIAHWLKGSPVPNFQPGKVYVVEYWATWCGPCIASMPHLSELQKRHADSGLTIIGVTSRDSNGNDLGSARKMVENKGERMGYTVAFDKERRSHLAWMAAAGRKGIPASFLIDQKGRIAWMGHPLQLDIPIAEVLAGTWDLVEGPKKMKRISDAQNEVYRSSRSNPKLALEQFEKLAKEFPSVAAQMHEMHFLLLVKNGRMREVRALGEELLEKHALGKNPGGLNSLAWTLVDPGQKLADRQLDLALKAAQKAAELTNNEDGLILDTLARVHFWKGDLERALEIQTRAVELVDSKMKAELKKAQAEYERHLKSGKNS